MTNDPSEKSDCGPLEPSAAAGGGEAARYERLAQLFAAACELPPGELAEFLDTACGDDHAMKRELTRMIEQDALVGTMRVRDGWAPKRGDEDDPAACNPGEPLPERIGSFRVLAKIGEGGMGAVYHAIREADYVQHVAIKLLKRSSDTEEFRQRFRNEVKFLADLGQHPNIAGLLEAGSTEEGVPYLVMEYVDGQRIDAYCDEHRLSIRERLTLFLEVCVAVQFAHQHTVIHRDIKPNNILVADDRSCHLIDFGIAKLLNPESAEDDHLATRTAYRVLTPEYASPEQARGEPLTTASDVYSLGVVLYELLTGHRPHEVDANDTPFMITPGDSKEPEKPSSAVHRVFTRQTHEGEKRITPQTVSHSRNDQPRRLRRELAGDLDNIVLMALRSEPQRRYGSAEQLAADIRRHLDGLPVLARKDTLWYRCGKFVRRNRAGVAAAALVLLSLLLGIVGTSVQWVRAERESTRATRAAEAANAQRDVARREQYRSAIAAAISALQEDNAAAVIRLLQQAPEEHRSWEWRYADSQRDMSIISLPGPRHESSAVAFSPTGDRLATISEHRTVNVWDVENWTRVFELRGHQDEIWEVEFNADGTRLATVSVDRTARLWDAATGNQIAVLGDFGHPFITFSPDGALVAAACEDHAIRVWHADSGRTHSVLVGHEDEINRVAFRPDSAQLASGSSDQTVRLWDLGTASEVAVLRGHRGQIPRLAYSPDGSRLASGGYFPDTSVRIWDVASGASVAVITGHENTINALSFDGDGKLLLSASDDQTARVWSAQDGAPLVVLRGHRDGVKDAYFNSGGAQIVSASSDSTVRLWETSTGNLISVLRGHTGRIDAIAASPDGTLMASSANDGSTRIWNTQPGLRDGVLRGHENFVYDVAIRPGDKQVASVAWDGTVRVWDLIESRQLHVLEGEVGIYSTVDFSPDGTQIACGTDQRTLHIWDLATFKKRVLGEPRTDWYPHPVPVAFSPNGKSVAALHSDYQLYRWDCKTGEKERICGDDAGNAVALAFHPRGRQLVIGTLENRLLCWDAGAQSLTEVPLPEGTAVRSIAFSRDASWLAIGGESRKVAILDTETWKPVAVLASPVYTYAISFGLDDQRMACACRDNTIRLWDTSTWKLVAELAGHQNYVHGLSFTHDGTRLVSGSGDFTVRIWDTVPLRERLERHASPSAASKTP